MAFWREKFKREDEKIKEEEAAESIHLTRKKYESPQSIKSPEEEILASREKKSLEKIGYGITDSSFVELKDDGKGIFKGSDYKNERAAYLVDRFLNLRLTPPTVIRKIDGKIGSIQKFIENTSTANSMDRERVEFIEAYKNDLIKLWIFDLIIKNRDRHGGNLLVKGDNIYAIDHGFSFNYENDYNEIKEHCGYYDPYTSFYDTPLPQDIIDNFKRFNDTPELKEILRELLTELLGKKTADTCIQRIEYITKIMETTNCIPEKLHKSRHI